MTYLEIVLRATKGCSVTETVRDPPVSQDRPPCTQTCQTVLRLTQFGLLVGSAFGLRVHPFLQFHLYGTNVSRQLNMVLHPQNAGDPAYKQ